MDRRVWQPHMSETEQHVESFPLDHSGIVQPPPAAITGQMGRSKDIHACTRCRQFKRKCDSLVPACARCNSAGVSCSRGDEGAESQRRQSSSGQSLGVKSDVELTYSIAGTWGTKRRSSAMESDEEGDPEGSGAEDGIESDAGETMTPGIPQGPAKKKRARA